MICEECGHDYKFHDDVGGSCRKPISSITAMHKGEHHNYNGLCECAHLSGVNEEWGLRDLKRILIETIDQLQSGELNDDLCTPEEQGELNYKIFINNGWIHGESYLEHCTRLLVWVNEQLRRYENGR